MSGDNPLKKREEMAFAAAGARREHGREVLCDKQAKISLPWTAVLGYE